MALYPPLINTYMPAFTGPQCKIYFSLSNFNSRADIKHAQIIVNDKNTNLNMLNPNKYPAGIKIAEIQEDKNINNEYRYYITIDNFEDNDINILPDIENGFITNRYYKVQIRFSSIEAETDLNIKHPRIDWLLNNTQYFSEWSTVCLIRKIDEPEVTIRGFEEMFKSKEVAFTNEDIQFIGNIKFNNSNNNEPMEYLKNATMTLINQITTEELEFGDFEISRLDNSINEFSYNVMTKMENNINYVLKFYYETSGGYEKILLFPFKSYLYQLEKLNAKIEAFPDNEEGRMLINITQKHFSSEAFNGKITIRRASSEDGFSKWEDVHNITLNEDKILNYQWYDYTVKSGVWYKYCVQKRNRKNDRGISIQLEEPVRVYFDDAFLVGDNCQLKLKFNTNIDNFKYNVLESKIDTLGSKYPFINRHAESFYKEFTIRGLITSFCDEAELFTSKKNIYKDMLNYHEEYNNLHDISSYQDFSYEREFRECVINFLYNNSIKLFKSPTEGNILVKLMNISLTPDAVLGRMLYTFSATAIEIDEPTINNFNNYKVQSISNLDEELMRTITEKPGSLEATIALNKILISRYTNNNSILEFNADEYNNDLIKIINQLYQKDYNINYNNIVNKLKYLKLSFLSKPYLINSDLQIIDNKNLIKSNEQLLYGFLIEVNGQKIVIPENKQYKEYSPYDSKDRISVAGYPSNFIIEYGSIILNDIDIQTLKIYNLNDFYNTKIAMQYIAECEHTEDISKNIIRAYYKNIFGQLANEFECNNSFINDIKDKYIYEYPSGFESLTQINQLSIEAPTGTVIAIQDSKDDDYNIHIINDNGFLIFNDENILIKDAYFKGIHLNKAPYQENYYQIQNGSFIIEKEYFVTETIYNKLLNNEYILQFITFSEDSDGNIIINKDNNLTEYPKNPVHNGVYRINGNFEIYYQHSWFPFDVVNEIVQYPITALINYNCDVIEGVYNQNV